MTRSTLVNSKHVVAVLGLSCLWATPGPAQSQGITGQTAGLTAQRFDGIYKGSSQQIATSDKSCRPPQELTVKVENGRIKLAWNDRQVFEGKVLPDGRFYASTEPAADAEKHMIIVPTLEGSIGKTGLVADYGTRWCRYRLAADPVMPAQTFTDRTGGAAAPR